MPQRIDVAGTSKRNSDGLLVAPGHTLRYHYQSVLMIRMSEHTVHVLPQNIFSSMVLWKQMARIEYTHRHKTRKYFVRRFMNHMFSSHMETHPNIETLKHRTYID